MDASAIQKIAELAERAGSPLNHASIDGVTYAPVPMHAVDRPAPTASPLTFSRLSGLVDYITNLMPTEGKSAVALHVVDHQTVQLVGPLSGRFKQRDVFAAAEAPERMVATPFAFGRFLEGESMIIALQALFEPNDGRAVVLKLLGNMKGEWVRTEEDDGVTQQVSVRAGAHLKDMAAVPNPVVLAPRRTFDEITQPESPFILRVRKSDEGALSAALFEADGGAWRSAAMIWIADYLRDKVGGLPVLV